MHRPSSSSGQFPRLFFNLLDRRSRFCWSTKMKAKTSGKKADQKGQKPSLEIGPAEELALWWNERDERLLDEQIPQKKPKIVHEMGKRPNCAVYGAGLTSTGALAMPHFVRSASTGPVCLNRPMRIGRMNVKRIKFVAAGHGFSLFASASELYGSGLNSFYQLSGPRRRFEEEMSDKEREQQSMLALLEHEGRERRAEAEPWYVQGKRIALPECFGHIRGISAGRMHSVVLSNQNKLLCFGSNTLGQCAADPSQFPEVTHNKHLVLPLVKTFPLESSQQIVQVHASLDSTFALCADGRLFAWGLGTDGQLGNGNMDIQWHPELVGGDLKGEQIRHIGGSTDTLVAVSAKGDLFIWGQNEHGQLGALTDEPQIPLPRHIPFKMGKIVHAEATGSSCIVCNSEGHVFTWGSYILGFGPKVDRLERPMQLDPPLFASALKEGHRVEKVFASGCSMGALTEAGHLFLWGSNRFSTLALGHPNHQYFPFQLSLAETVKQASLGPTHSLFITNQY